MRCFGAIHDDLHDYAAEILVHMTEHLAANPLSVRSFGTFDCAVLHRLGNLQTEFVMGKPQAELPPHMHPNVDSIDLLVSGNVSAFQIGEQRIGRFIKGVGLRIPAGEWHGGRAGPGGMWFVSCQRWRVPPTHIVLDWQGAPATDEHKRMLEALGGIR